MKSDGVASFFLLDETCTHLALVHNVRFGLKPSGWGLPGGRINGELDKTEENYIACFKKAAFRELREETGLEEKDVMDLDFFHPFTTGRILSPILQSEAPLHLTIPVVVFAGIALKDIVRTTAVPQETDRCDWFPFSPDDPTAHLPPETYRSHVTRIRGFVDALRTGYAWDHIQYTRAQKQQEEDP